jgi:hypothetical protein
VAHVFADFSSKNVFFTEGGIFAAKTVEEPNLGRNQKFRIKMNV